MLNDKIRYLYCEKNLNAREVGEIVGLSCYSILKRMARNNIPRRTSVESHQLLFDKKKPSYHMKKKLSMSDKFLKIAALMLYWGEGSKKGKWTIDFVNSNSQMVSLFLRALRQIYGVDESKLRVLLYCYPNQDKESLIKYWSSKLGIKKEQFTKPYIRKEYNVKNINVMPRGLVHIRYSDKKLLEQVMHEIDIIQSNLNTPR